MYMVYIVSFSATVLPIAAISFVAFLVVYKFYKIVRSKFNVKVNCWFCNENASVPYNDGNSWTCPCCEQYNGFTKDGDYNREIFEQLDCSNLSNRSGKGYKADLTADYVKNVLLATDAGNGFCDACNEAQRLKVEKLAQFDPKVDSRFNQKLKQFKQQLEEQHCLCFSCDLHLKRVLREKKKMVLGSKFFDFIVKGSTAIRQSNFNRIRIARKSLWKRRLVRWIIFLTVANMYTLAATMTGISRVDCTKLLGDTIGWPTFVALSHFLTLAKVLLGYVEDAFEHTVVSKLLLYVHTLILMVLCSMGFKVSQLLRLSFKDLYARSCPFALLGLAFAYNAVDRFHVTRFTFLLAIWSTLASGLADDVLMPAKDAAMLVTSLITLVLALFTKNKNGANVKDDIDNSFHRIYSDDYLSDDESIATTATSHNGSCSSTLNRSVCAATPPKRPQPLPATIFNNQRTPPATFNKVSSTPPQPYASIFGNRYTPAMSSFSDMLPTLASLDHGRLQQQQRKQQTSPHDSILWRNTTASANVSQRRNDGGDGASRYYPYSLRCDGDPARINGHLLTPSRFSLNTDMMINNVATSPWLSSLHQRLLTAKFDGQNFENRTATSSRASSHSSGFESQNGQQNSSSRDNSPHPDGIAKNQPVTSGFHPIEPLPDDIDLNKSRSAFNRIPASTAHPRHTLTHPWRPTSMEYKRRSAIMDHWDPFNLRKIDENLPTIRRHPNNVSPYL